MMRDYSPAFPRIKNNFNLKTTENTENTELGIIREKRLILAILAIDEDQGIALNSLPYSLCSQSSLWFSS